MDQNSTLLVSQRKPLNGAVWFDSVLIVDDDPIQHALIEDYFSSRGATRILHAWNGCEAQAYLREEPHLDLITIDLVMPGCDGVELLDALRTSGCDVPVLIVSGTYEATRSAASVLAQAYDLNVVGALAKPITVARLDEVLQPARKSGAR